MRRCYSTFSIVLTECEREKERKKERQLLAFKSRLEWLTLSLYCLACLCLCMLCKLSPSDRLLSIVSLNLLDFLSISKMEAWLDMRAIRIPRPKLMDTLVTAKSSKSSEQEGGSDNPQKTGKHNDSTTQDVNHNALGALHTNSLHGSS